MASFAVGGTGCQAELPRVRVAVIRHQSETILSPSNDVVPFLEARGGDRWAVTTFDERDFGGALGAADFDVIVLGYNATLFTPPLRAALRATPPTVPVLLLHQREQHCFGFLANELALEIASLDDSVRRAVVPRERAASFEPLLNWPHAVLTEDGCLAVKAIRGLAFAPESAWRVVLEAQQAAQRLPVLIRTRADHRQRIVACTLLLRPAAEEAHGRLLENLLVFCAFGWPDVGLVEVQGDAASAARIRDLELGMGMWTERCVRVTVPAGSDLPITTWPLRGVHRIVAPAELSPDRVRTLDGAAEWLRRGGELIRVGDDGTIAVDAQLNDRFMVLRAWAMWFGGLPEDRWLTRLGPARAVLRVLAAVAACDDAHLPADVRFRVMPTEYVHEVRRLLDDRVRGGNIDETISATTTALDLDRLTGEQALTPFQRRGVRRWLADHLDGATRGEQLDILRCLGDPDLLAGRLRAWNEADDWHATEADRRVDALVVTRLREAVHACWPGGDEPADLLTDGALATIDGPHVEEDLRHSPLLCADFVTAVHSRPPGSPGAMSALFDPARHPRSVAVAVAGLAAHGLYAETQDVRPVCAHTEAILHHLERHPAGLRFLAGRGELPSSAAESVLQEATRARQSERESRRDLPALGKAVLVLGTVTLAAALLGLLALWRVGDVGLRAGAVWTVLAFVVPAALLALIRWRWLERREVSERRDLRLGQHAMGLAALLVALVPATLVWRLASPGGDFNGFALGLAPLAWATALALLLLVLRRFDLTPGWATALPGAGGDVRSPLALLLRKLGEPRASRTTPP